MALGPHYGLHNSTGTTFYIQTMSTSGGEAGIDIVEGAAHSELDPGMMEAMARALDSLVKN